MTQGIRPDGQVFASNADDGELENFPAETRGWGVTIDGKDAEGNTVTAPTNGIPPMEWMNGILNKLSNQILWNMQHAVPSWVAGTWDAEAFVTYSGWIYYNSSGAQTTDTPESGTAWTKLFPLSNIDGRYLQIANNLSEIAAAGAEAQSKARGNLALGTAATATLTTSTTDNTMGHVLKIGDRGLGVTVADTAIGFDFANHAFGAGETLFVQMSSAINYPAELSVFASTYVYLNVIGVRNQENNTAFIVADYNSNRAYFCWRWSEGGANLTWFVNKLPIAAVDVGAMPLYPTPLAVDLNTLGASSSAGVYCQQADINATPELNYPVQQSGTLLVTPSAYGCQQEYTTFGSGQKFTRGLATNFDGSGPWQPWVPQYSPGNPPPATDLSAYATQYWVMTNFVQGFSFGAVTQVAVSGNQYPASPGCVLSAIQDNDTGNYPSFDSVDAVYQKPAQVLINGIWVTVAG